jgi:hypothetical protein
MGTLQPKPSGITPATQATNYTDTLEYKKTLAECLAQYENPSIYIRGACAQEGHNKYFKK